jgi:hypothetical protein
MQTGARRPTPNSAPASGSPARPYLQYRRGQPDGEALGPDLRKLGDLLGDTRRGGGGACSLGPLGRHTPPCAPPGTRVGISYPPTRRGPQNGVPGHDAYKDGVYRDGVYRPARSLRGV